MEQKGTTGLPAQLAATALELGAGPDLGDILACLQRAVQPAALVGLGLHDPRRQVLVVLLAEQDGSAEAHDAPAEGIELPIGDTEWATFARSDQPFISPPFGSPDALPIEGLFAKAGRRRFVSLPLRLGLESIGVLYAGLDSPEEPAAELLELLAGLARIVPPAVQNERTRARLRKGDRRRASLAELSDAINNSLELDAVLRSTLEAVHDIEGHLASMIMLRSEDSPRLECHAQMGAGSAAAKLHRETLDLVDTPLPWVLENKRTFESADLQAGAGYSIDRTLSRSGVRRYAIAPMFIRGRIIGGFLFGTADPHPALTTDVWLYENIALQLALAIDNALQFGELKRLSDRLAEQNVYLREEIATEHNVGGMVGQSRPLQRVVKAIQRVASTESTVLITGETGVGKELVARAIHEESDRADHPLVKVNCAAIPENLVESELFGHERGAFTSATARRIGRFELARDGTIFLDEVGELPLAVQTKLLRVLQEREFERVGSSQTLTTDARVIAATNRDLLEAVEKKSFRSDLYYRLNVFPIRVPALADRREDIPLLAEAFVAQFNRRMGKRVKRIHPDTLSHLTQATWHGNIREFRHVIERAMILCDEEELVIESADLDVESGPSRPGQPAGAQHPARGDLLLLELVEREHITHVLESTGWRVEGPGAAAEILGLKPSTLRSRMKKLSIKRS